MLICGLGFFVACCTGPLTRPWGLQKQVSQLTGRSCVPYMTSILYLGSQAESSIPFYWLQASHGSTQPLGRGITHTFPWQECQDHTVETHVGWEISMWSFLENKSAPVCVKSCFQLCVIAPLFLKWQMRRGEMQGNKSIQTSLTYIFWGKKETLKTSWDQASSPGLGVPHATGEQTPLC